MQSLHDMIREAATGEGLDPALVAAIVSVESSGRCDAFRHEPAFYRRYLASVPFYAGKDRRRVSSSYGLMQVMYSTAIDEGFPPTQAPELLFVPEVNLRYGCAHLRGLLEWAQGDVERALAAYNGGKKGNDKAPLRNAAYVAKVMGRLKR